MAIASRRRRVFAYSPIVLAMLSAQASLAQTKTQAPSPAPTLPEVQVTGPAESPYRQGASSSLKATSSLLDTAQTVQVIPRELLAEQGARNLTEALSNTPGITFNAGENGFSTSTNSFSLRGFDTSGNIFVDGFRDSGTYARDTFNLERVEVIKGPSADNGRGGAGGYVNLQSKSPALDNFVGGTLGYGFDNDDSGDRRRATADINRRIGERNAAWRLNLLAEDSGIAGRQYANVRNFGFAPSVAFGLGEPTTVTLSYQHLRQDSRPDWGVPAAMVKGMMRYDPVSATAGRSNFYGLLSDYDDSTSNALLARVEHRISPTLRISNHTRWARTEREALFTVPTAYAAATATVTTQRQAYQRENTSVGNLTNLSADFTAAGLQHRAAAGLELTRETSSANRYPTNGVLGNAGTTDLFNPDPRRPLAGFVGPVASQIADVTIQTVALYAYDTVEFSPQWQMTGGVRLERYRTRLDSRTAAGAPQGPDGYERSETTFGGKLGVIYKPVAQASIYASYGQSALPPGSFLSGSDISREGDNAFPGWTGQNHRNSKAQRSTHYEVGAKWDLRDHRLSTGAALFRTERSRIAMGPAAAEPVGYGRQIVQGLELSIAGAVTSAWSVFGGLTFLDSERRHNAAIDAALKGDYANGVSSTNGDELAFTPKVAASLWSTYKLPMGLTLGAGLRHTGKSWVGRPDTADRVIPNGQAGRLPGYTVVNLMAAYPVSPQLTLRLNIDNVGDKLYANSANWAGSRVTLGAPRTFLVSADMRF